jgi:CRP-like cAMP-binding protein/rhodanese-related sulfurtransferase
LKIRPPGADVGGSTILSGPNLTEGPLMTEPFSDADVLRLKELVPLFSLSDERLRELAALATRETHRPGVYLFRQGDLDNQTVYLLQGKVRLLYPDGDADGDLVAAGTAEARHPLAEQQPRAVSAVAHGEVTVLRVDNNVLDYMITWDQLAMLHQQSPAPESADGGADGSWISTLANSLPFQRVPPANVRSLLERMERIEVKPGDMVVRQDESGDYYYLLARGTARVTRTVELARLGEGASFGEEALLADVARNASVTMTSDGTLLRLSKKDFNELLKAPLLNWLSPADARNKVNGGAVWLDVRHAREFRHYRLPNAVSLPLHELRQRMDELDRSLPYICYCKTGRRSSAAAFLLSQSGFDASVLRGGLHVLPPLLRR